jgi:hypothetical protein
MISEVPEEIRQQIHEASVDAKVEVCFSRSLIPDFNVDQIDLIESALEEKRLEEIQQGSPLTNEEVLHYQTAYVESDIKHNGPSEGFKLIKVVYGVDVSYWGVIHPSGGGMYYEEKLVGVFSNTNEASAFGGSVMDTETLALKQYLAKIHQLKQSMMQELLTGRTRLVKPNPVN